MALVNVAADLARSGRRVLMVDFDLEAPGLSEYGFLEPYEQTPGIVEFISDYIKSGEAPDADRYIHQSKKYAETGDRLWIMPAGCQRNPEYQRLFSSISWQELYEEKDGFLLMEDLRSQWEDKFKFDYVFIDSRTGYTDIAGICTRQLPDTVCLLFTPNKQNLAGLKRITSEIKAQSTSTRLRKPQLRFVASNVPNLDDDVYLLERALSAFSEQLEYAKPTAIIHHFSSFALLDEVVFTLEHPNGQLSKQYKDLGFELTKDNLFDRLSALEFLKTLVREVPGNVLDLTAEVIDTRLGLLEGHFSDDGEILFWLSRARRTFGNLEESYALLDAAIQKGHLTSRAFIDRASIKATLGNAERESIWDDLREVFGRVDSVPVSELLFAIRLAFRIEQSPDDIKDANALKNLSATDFLFLAFKLENSRPGMVLMLRLALEMLHERVLSVEQTNRLLEFVGNAYIAFGQLDKAIESFMRMTTIDLSLISVEHAFNMGMAKYWRRDEDAKIYLMQALELFPVDKVESDLNNLQCLSFLHWIKDGSEAAQETLNKAIVLLESKPLATFSCWRYMQVTPNLFKQDLSEMQKLYQGQAMQPAFLRAPLRIEM